MHLHLELGASRLLGLSQEVVSVDDVDCLLELLNVFFWVASEGAGQSLIEMLQYAKVDFQKVFSSLGVALQLFSVHECAIDVGLSDEVHELENVLILRACFLLLVLNLVGKVLVSCVYTVSVH